MEMKLLIVPEAGGDNNRPINRNRQNETIIIIGMFPDEVDAARSAYHDIRISRKDSAVLILRLLEKIDGHKRELV